MRIAVWWFVAGFCAISEVVTAFHFCGVIYYPPLSKSSTPAAASVPLHSVSIKADVRGLAMGIIAELNYINPLAEDIETQFVLPLSDEAAVYRLEAVIGGRKLVAKVEPREEAEKKYRQAVDDGKKAVLLANERGVSDVFRLSLGNLPAKGEAVITLGYVQPIDRMLDDGVISVTLPMVLNPRYVPHHELLNQQIMKERFASADFVSVSEITYTLNFDATVTLGVGRRIDDIQTRHHHDRIDVAYADEGQLSANVTLINEFSRDHDFQLLIKPATQFEPMVYVEPGVLKSPTAWLNRDVAAFWLKPGSDLLGDSREPSHFEFWLVIDRSGSMTGQRMEDAKSALSLLVRKLPFGCKFNIIGFGSNYVSLFPNGVVPYDNETETVAFNHLQEIEANLGGTEILQPLRFIYEHAPVDKNKGRSILLLTDGEVSNVDEVIAIAKQNAETTRVFSIGIGEGASTALVNGVARVSNGLASFVRAANDRLETKVFSMLAAMTSPLLKSTPVIQWSVSGGDMSSLVPKQLGRFYIGTPITQYAIMVRLFGRNLTGYAEFSPNRYNYLVGSTLFSGVEDTLPLHRLAAKRALTDLADLYAASRSDEFRNEAVAVSIATSVLCEFTAMVAVDAESNEPVIPANSKISEERLASTMYKMSLNSKNSNKITWADVAGRPSSSSSSSSAVSALRNCSFTNFLYLFTTVSWLSCYLKTN